MNYSIIHFEAKGDQNGSLIALEDDYIPFEIKRVYYIYGTLKDIVRGCHAHRDLEQVIVCVSGACDFIMDDGSNRERVRLDSPEKGLYLNNNIWREFTNFSPDCVIMVLASKRYDESDYIRDYSEFKQFLKNSPDRGK